jgi:RHS repeat-associated protein
MSGQTLQKAFVPLAGGSMAVYNSSGLAYYRHSDWLGSSRFASTPARALYFDGAYAPFGESYAQTGTTDLSFTGMNQDTVANLFDFPAREYNGIHGRWPSPDPAGIHSVRMKDPQTFNRYAYARNNPLARVDPTGLDDDDPDPDQPADPVCSGDDDDDDGCAAGGGGGDGDVTDDGSGNDDNSCDTDCSAQITIDEINALDNYTANPACAAAVDGGTGVAAASLTSALSGGSDNTTITTANIPGGPLASETSQGYIGTPNVISTITINTGAFFSNVVPTLPTIPQSYQQVIVLLHELGHVSEFTGVPTAIQPDQGPGLTGTAAGLAASYANSATISAACPPAFGDSDAGSNPDPSSVDGSGGAVAAIKRSKKF